MVARELTWLRCAATTYGLPNLPSAEMTTMKLHIAQVVPSFLPGQDGLGDYAFRLALELADSDIETTFIVAGHRHRGRKHGGEGGREVFNTLQLDESEPAGLIRLLSSVKFDALVVHMSGYGYENKGAPAWLVSGLEEYKAETGTPIISVFHELWQKPVPWRKTLIRWYSQYRVMRRLFVISEGYITNAHRRLEKLQSWDPGKPGLYSPVFSNIGELDQLEPKETDLAVVFGLSLGRRRTYRALASKAADLAEFGIKRIIDIGDPAFPIPDPLRKIVVSRGQLDDGAVSQVLARSLLGFASYDGDVFAKSGVFNAYASHGVCTINMKSSAKGQDGLASGKQYLNWREANQAGAEIIQVAERVGRSAFDWYQGHNTRAVGLVFSKMIRGVVDREANEVGPT
jgi:hypothetical protein